MDLGHGTGKVVLSAALMHPFAQSSGIELFETLYTVSCDLKRIYADFLTATSDETYLERFGWPKEQATQSLSLELGDILEADWGECDLIFCASLLFGVDIMQRVYEKSLSCKKGSWFLTLGNRLPNTEIVNEEYPLDPEQVWEVKLVARLPMSWGRAPVILH